MVLLASIAAVSCTQELTTDADRLPAPKAAAGDITCTSFTVSWDIVTDAGSYTYVFNGGEPETTDKTSVTFTGLQPQTTYSFVLKADKGWNGMYADSEPVFFRITTSPVSALDTPEPELVAAYMSKTIFSWKPVRGATSYEYEIGPYSGSTQLCSIELGGLHASTDYVFSLRAVSSGEYNQPSEYARVSFTTRPAEEDIPQIILKVIECGSDYISFDVYALPDQNYLFFAVPASYFATASDSDVTGIFMNYFRSAASDAGLSLPAAVSQYAMSGTGNYTEAPVYPEMNYYVAVIGLDSEGNVNSPLVKSPARTFADGDTDEHPVSEQNWFQQLLYHGTFGAYNPSNSLWVKWEGGVGDAKTDSGKKVKMMKNLLTSTYSYRTFFGSDLELLKLYVESRGTEFRNAEDIKKLNSGGFSSYYKLPAATSFTLASVVEAEDGTKGFAVNTLATKSSETYYDWAFVKLGATSSEAVLAANLSIAFDGSSPVNIGISEVKYLLKKTSEISGMSLSDASEMVNRDGVTLKKPVLDMLNMTGSVSLEFGNSSSPLEAGEKYTLLVNFTSNASDKVIRFATATVPHATSNSSSKASRLCSDVKVRSVIGNVNILETFDVEYE